LVVEATANPQRVLEQLPNAQLLPGEPELQCLIALARGLAFRTLMKLSDAAGCFDEALRCATAHDLVMVQVRVLTSRAANYALEGRFELATADLDRAGQQATSAAKAQLLHQRAGIVALTGDFDTAVSNQSRALRSFRRSGDRLWEARALQNRSMMHLLTGQVTAGLRDAQASIKKYDELEHHAGVAKATHNLAGLQAWAGHTTLAMQTFDTAEHHMRSLGIPVGQGSDSRAEALMIAGLYADAVGVAEHGVLEHRTSGAGALEAEALLIESRAAFALGDLARAQYSAQLAQNLFGKQNRNIHQSRALLLVAQSTRTLHATDAERLATALDSLGWEEVSTVVWQLAISTAIQHRDHSAAIRFLNEVTKKRPSGLMSRVGLHRSRGLLCLLNDDQRGALRHCRAGMRLARQHRMLLGTLELRTASGSLAQEIADLGKQAALLGDTHGAPSLTESRRIAMLWRWSELGRHIETGTARSVPIRETVLLAQHRALSSRIDTDDAVGATQPFVQQRKRIEEDLRHLERQRNQSVINPAPATVRQIQAELHSQTMIAFFEVGADLFAICLDANEATYRLLGPTKHIMATLEKVRATLHRIVHEPDPEPNQTSTAAFVDANPAGVLRNQLDELDDRLALATFLPPSRRNEVVVIPTGNLFAIPWNMLPSLATGPVTVALTGTEWLSAPTARPWRRCAVIEGTSLRYARQECDAVASIWNRASQPSTGSHKPVAVTIDNSEVRQPSVAAALRAFKSASVVHIAAHTTLRPDNPAFSAIHLQDGPLYLQELDSITNPPELVVLSSCASAIALGSKGAEVQGFASRLLSLGVRTVIAPVVAISDQAIASAIAELHRNLAAGTNAATSLYSMQRLAGTSDLTSCDAKTAVTVGAFVCLGRSA
jgi:tetratricopeptide (TPR) repeat protein